MQIITRYLLKEMMQTLLAVTFILLFIFTCNIFIRYLNYVAAGKYAGWVIFHIVSLQIPILLGILLPLGVYLGVLLGLGRLYADSEMTVLSACGLGKKNLLKILIIFAAIVTIFTAILSMYIEPRIVLESREILAAAKGASILETVSPGRFETINDGQRVFYVQGVNKDRSAAQNIFIAEKLKPEASSKTKMPELTPEVLPRWVVLSALQATQAIIPELKAGYMLLNNGYLYKGTPGLANYQEAHYQTYGIRLSEVSYAGLNQFSDSQSTIKLFGHYSQPDVAAELQWRISAPLSVIILALLAFPLAKLSPRQGRYAKLLPAALLYIIYANLMFIGRGWVASGSIPIWLGLWWIHAIFLGLAIWLWSKQR